MKEIVILSGKGGTGKTSLSAAFATLEKNIVVADCDVDAANLYLVLQPKNTKAVNFITGLKAIIDYDKCNNCGFCIDYCRFEAISLINNKVSISEISCDGCKLCSRICPEQAIYMLPNDKSQWFSGTFRNGYMVHARLFPGEENSGKLVNVVREQTKKIAIEKEIDTVIIDGPPGTGCPVISSITGTNQVILVTEPSKSGFHDLQRIYELVSKFRIESYIAINKYDLNIEMALQIEEWSAQNKIPIIGKIKFDAQIVEAMINCKSIVEWDPESETVNEIKNIWNQIND